MRRAGSIVAGVLAVIALAVALVAGWTERSLVSTDGFVELTSELSDSTEVQQRVREYAVDELVDETGLERRLAAAATEVLARVAAEVLSDDEFAAAWEQTVRLSHEAMLSGEVPDGRLRLELAPVASVIAERSDGIVEPVESAAVDLGGGPSAERIDQVQRFGDLALPAAILAGVLAVVALVLARRPAIATAWLALGALTAGAIVWAASWTAAPAVGATMSGARRELLEALTDVTSRSLRETATTTMVIAAAVLALAVLWAILTRPRSSAAN